MSTTPFSSTNGFATSGNITVESGSYFIGDGSQLTGIAPTVQVYEFANVASGVSNYFTSEWLASYTPAALANVAVSVTTTATNIINFITDPGYPGITVIPTGTILVRAETTKGSGPQGYLIYAEIYKRTTGGVETLIATTDNSSTITQNAAVQQNIIAYITTPVTLDVTDRIVVKVFGQMTSGSATITFGFDNNTGSGLQLPALPPSVNNFVPYTGATANVDLGTRSLTTTANISTTASVVGLELYSTQSVGSEGGQLNLAVPASNTVLQNNVTVDIYQNRIRFFEGSANARGAFIDLSTCATGVATNLVNRASTIAGSNTAVTLDNIQARVGGSPVRLYINTVTGNLTGAGASQTMSSGATSTSSWINVPIGTGAANAFAMSGALTSNGDTAVLNLTDQGSGTGMWRITGMIANTTANLYGVTIERLV